MPAERVQRHESRFLFPEWLRVLPPHRHLGKAQLLRQPAADFKLYPPALGPITTPP
jgi:hypothetical protein